MEEAFAECERITASKQPNLYLVGRYLPGEKYRLFLATYAAMRVIDDFVDNDFLCRPDTIRQSTRKEALETIDTWLEQTLAAVEERLPANNAFPASAVFTALKHAWGSAAIGPTPWLELAEAMRWDVNEMPIKTWGGFFKYCEGATVAPAVVFISILACRMNKDGRPQVSLPNSCHYYARNMALFCYLVHILRDLWRDSMSLPQLVTIPDETLSACHLTKASLRTVIANKESDRLAPLVKRLMEEARKHGEIAAARVDEITKILPLREGQILRALFQLYALTFSRLDVAVPDFFEGGISLSASEVNRIISSHFSDIPSSRRYIA